VVLSTRGAPDPAGYPVNLVHPHQSQNRVNSHSTLFQLWYRKSNFSPVVSSSRARFSLKMFLYSESSLCKYTEQGDVDKDIVDSLARCVNCEAWTLHQSSVLAMAAVYI